MGVFKNPKKILRRRRRFPRGRAARSSPYSQRGAEPIYPIHPANHRGQTVGVSLRVKRVAASAPRLARRRRKKTTCLHRWFFCVGENLFFRAVSSQVSSAPASLTSVFGMGTGGPSRQSTPTIQFAASLDSLNIIPQPFENCKPFFKIFRKNFAAKAAGLEKRLSQIVLNRANAGQRLSKTNEEPSLSTLSYPASHRGHKASVLLRVKRVATSAPRLARRRRKKTTCLHRWFFCVGENLFFRAVSSQVSSAPASLTSVFGMGTGGPSRQSTPTIQFAASLDSLNIIPQPFENCKPFFKIFRKNFATKAAGMEKRLPR